MRKVISTYTLTWFVWTQHNNVCLPTNEKSWGISILLLIIFYVAFIISFEIRLLVQPWNWRSRKRIEIPLIENDVTAKFYGKKFLMQQKNIWQKFLHKRIWVPKVLSWELMNDCVRVSNGFKTSWEDSKDVINCAMKSFGKCRTCVAWI